MLRPATPLSILLFASFVLLLLSTLSTPIIKGLPLARYENVNFGVFGWCKDDGSCSGIRIGWNAADAIPKNSGDNFNFSANTRHSLSSLLVVHPVAAFCNLIALALAVAAHLHSPSHSARYLLGLLIFLLPTLLVTLLAFLVDILLFVPHIPLRAGWIVLASTILITISGVVTCAMRRTLVSRKARKKRIAENAEMNGENYHNRQAQETAKMLVPALSTESKAPLVHGAPGSETLPPFATYNPVHRMEERQGPPRPAPPPDSFTATSPIDGNDRYYGERARSNSGPRSGDYGAPLGPVRSPEDRAPPMPYPPRGGYGPPRGRGGYPPRGAMGVRGGYGPRGPPPQAYGRGSYPNRGRGGYGPPMVGRGPSQRGGPPPGYPPQGRMTPEGYGPPNGVAGPIPAGGPNPVPYSRPDEPGYEPPSPSAYTDGRTSMPVYGARAQSPRSAQRSPSPPPAMPLMPHGSHSGNSAEPTLPILPPESQEYVPPRAGWNDPQQTAPQEPGITRVNSGGSDYMEDVDPRFAEAQTEPMPSAQPHVLPSSLAAGRNPKDLSPESSSNALQPAHSYENLSGARSPAGSETSEFTSISQRGVNPDWRPGHGGEFNSFGPVKRRQQQQRQDMLFSGNPDFEIPNMGPPGRTGPGLPRGGPGHMRGGYRGSGAPPRMQPPSAIAGVGGDGRYPMESPPPPAPGMIKEI